MSVIQRAEKCGLWWDEKHNPQCLSAPRGALIRAALPELSITPAVDLQLDGWDACPAPPALTALSIGLKPTAGGREPRI